MVPSKWLGVTSAAGSLALILIGFAIHGSFEAQESTAKVANYYATHAHKTNVWAGGYVEFLGYLLFAVFIAWLWSVLRSGEAVPSWPSALMLMTGSAYIALTAATFAPLGAALRRGASISASATVALAELSLWLYYLSWAVAALMLVAAATSIARTRSLPFWLAWTAAALALVLLVAVPLRLAGIDVLLQVWGIATGIAWARTRRSGSTAPVS
jgi:archaellum biogenesis protein FlaJ (TadC family)